MKYLKLWLSFAKISVMAEMEYRLNMIIKVISDVIWYCTQLSIFEVLFYHAPQIAGWTIYSMRVFMGVLFLVDSFYMILMNENFEQSSTLVRKGELDFILVKPVNSQFMYSFRKVNAAYFINTLIVLCYLTWAILNLETPPHWSQFVTTFFLLIAGLSVLYSLRFFFAALNIIFTNANSLTYVWYQFYRLATRPHAFYPSWLRLFILTVFPVALISSVPATNLVQGLDLRLVFGAFAIAATLVFLTTRFWGFVLRRYSSASS